MFKSREVSAGTSHLHMYFSFVYNETAVINYCMTRFAEPVFPIARLICLTSDACENAISIIQICRTESWIHPNDDNASIVLSCDPLHSVD
jgi:hypothetical protein